MWLLSSGLQHFPTLLLRAIFPRIKTKQFTEALARVETWLPEVQNELAELALELDAGVNGAVYRPTAEEMAGIDRGLRAATEGRFASHEKVAAAFVNFGTR